MDAEQHSARGRSTRSQGWDAAALTFPDLPRLELDQLLAQLVERAGEVMAAQGRLRGLLRANQMIIGDLTLPVVLRRITEAARELIGARYCALGVLGGDGRLTEFVHVGMADEEVARIGDLPQGKGLLGALIDEPAPIRLTDIGEDARSSGFPPDHPPMHSFLGVPIRVREEVFGNLYLADSDRGTFSYEDEELSKALAATAAVAIDNARHFEASRRRAEWLAATTTVTRQLLAPPAAQPRPPLQAIAEHARTLSEADLVAVVVPDPADPRFLQVELADGVGADELVGRRARATGTVVEDVLRAREPVRLADPTERPGVGSDAGLQGLRVGPLLAAPLMGAQQPRGVLVCVRGPGRPAFSAEDQEMAVGFLSQSSLALGLAEARTEHERIGLLDERERIAADLHDNVIQRLFGAGLSLQGVAAHLGPGRNAERLGEVVRQLDDTIDRIRASIFALERRPGEAPEEPDP